MSKNFDQLEMELRALGRRIGASTDEALIERAKGSASLALARCLPAMQRRRRRKMLFGLAMMLVATLPIPAAFLWMDWTAVSSILRDLLPEQVMAPVLAAYAWLKVCTLTTIYGVGVPLLAWVAMQVAAPVTINGEEEMTAA